MYENGSDNNCLKNKNCAFKWFVIGGDRLLSARTSCIYHQLVGNLYLYKFV